MRMRVELPLALVAQLRFESFNVFFWPHSLDLDVAVH